MVEFFEMEKGKAAIVSNRLESNELQLIAEVEGLWLTPESDNFELQSPLYLPKLHTLYIKRCHQSLLDMVCKDSLFNLETLLIVDSSNSLKNIGDLSELPKIKMLKILQQQLDDVSFNWICQQKNLTHLGLTDTNATDSIVAMLGCKNSLERLDLYRSEVSFKDNELRTVVFPIVKSLIISETKISSDSIEIIRIMFPQLERLIIDKNKLSKSDARKIAAWDGLEILCTGNPDIDFNIHGRDFWY